LNNRVSEVWDYKRNGFKIVKWSGLKVGDIVRVNKDTEFPTDMLLVYAQKDIVYVDTMNLDGETNLKEKYLFSKDLDL